MQFSILFRLIQMRFSQTYAYMCIFGDFNIYHKDLLTYTGGTGRPGELCYNFSISNDLRHG